jgi:hypothetical protein
VRALRFSGATNKLRNYSDNSHGGFSVKNKLMKIGVLVWVILCAATIVSAQDVSKGPVVITSMKPPARVAIHAGKLLDPRTGNYANDVFILVEGDRIVSVGTSAPAGVEVIDLLGQTVLPGLADCHLHIISVSGDPLKNIAKMEHVVL